MDDLEEPLRTVVDGDDAIAAPEPDEVPDPEQGPPPAGYGGATGES